jgi:hypothetical protein
MLVFKGGCFPVRAMTDGKVRELPLVHSMITRLSLAAHFLDQQSALGCIFLVLLVAEDVELDEDEAAPLKVAAKGAQLAQPYGRRPTIEHSASFSCVHADLRISGSTVSYGASSLISGNIFFSDMRLVDF